MLNNPISIFVGLNFTLVLSNKTWSQWEHSALVTSLKSFDGSKSELFSSQGLICEAKLNISLQTYTSPDTYNSGGSWFIHNEKEKCGVLQLSDAQLSYTVTLSLTDLLVFQVSDERLDVMASHQSENGSISTASSTVSSLESEKAAYEFLAQTPIKSTDAHLVEFSEAMRSKDRHTLFFAWSLNVKQM